MKKDDFIIDKKKFSSRLIVRTGKYRNFSDVRKLLNYLELI